MEFATLCSVCRLPGWFVSEFITYLKAQVAKSCWKQWALIVKTKKELQTYKYTEGRNYIWPNKSKICIFSSKHGILPSIPLILDHKANSNKFGKIEVVQSNMSNQDGIKLEINSSKKVGKHKYVEISNMLKQTMG